MVALAILIFTDSLFSRAFE